MAARQRLPALLAACGLGCGWAPPLATLDWSAPVTPSPAPLAPLPRLSVEGTGLRTAAGPLRLRGVNVCSLEFDATGANWELGPDGSGLLAVLADPSRWNANAARMPLNQQWLLEDEDYRVLVERLIDDANARGVYLVLDVQWEVGRKLEPYHQNILEVPTFGEGNTTEAFWHLVTSRWANRTNLLFDLINEPHGRSDEETAEAMQVLVDAIRQRDDKTPIVIGGMNWAHSVEYYAQRPLRGPQLIYSAHQYLPWDGTDTFAAHFGRPAAKIPVLVGEFLAEEANSGYALALADAADASGAVGWLPWAVGCGFTKSSDQSGEPFASLARKMRAGR